MKPSQPQLLRVLGISLSTRGVGFALMEGKDSLVDWGTRVVKGDKNARCLSHIGNLINLYEPNVIVLEDPGSAVLRRATRIQALSKEISDVAKLQNLRVKVFTRKQTQTGLLKNSDGTKHAVAQHLAMRFPEELAFRLPKRRRCGMNADSRMDIFDAVALAEHYFQSVRERRKS